MEFKFISCNKNKIWSKNLIMLKNFNEKIQALITEMNENSFYPAKYVDGSQAVGTNCVGMEQIWMIGPTMERNIHDYITGEKLPQYTTILWLPNKLGFKKGIAISMDSFEAARQNPELNDKLVSLGLINDINWELA